MKHTVHSLVEELLELEPSLRGRREEVARVVQELLDSRMGTRWRPAFQQELLAVLRMQMGVAGKEAPHSSFFFPIFRMDSRFFFAGGGAVLGALLVFLTLGEPWAPAPGSPQPKELALEETVTPVAPHAFGSLAAKDAGGAGAGDAEMRMQAGGGGGGVAMESMMVPPGEYTQTRYVFEGDIPLPEGDLQVYRRIRPDANVPAGDALRGFASGMLDWSSFGPLRLQNVNVTEQGNDAYSFFVDYLEGSLSVNRMFAPESRPEFQCKDPECYERVRLRESDMLSDEEVIRIARAFIDASGIDASAYGEPVVPDDWRQWLKQSPDKTSFYFPEQVNVVFPLLLDGKPVYEEYGNPFGLTVGVDVRTKSAASLYNHFVQRYEQSAYAPVTDASRVRDLIDRGGMYMWRDPSAKLVDAKLGAPQEALMRMVQWDPDYTKNKELYVPALVFPVESWPEGTYDYRKYIVVPLADELLNMQDGGMPRPMPFVEPAAEEAAQ